MVWAKLGYLMGMGRLLRLDLFMNESGFWQSLRKHLVPRVYALKLNLNFVQGVPDVWLSGSEQDLWIENKYLKTLPPIVDATKLLTVLQQLWLEERYNEGRRVGVLLGSSEGHVFLPGLSWKKSLSRLSFLDQAVSTKVMANQLVELLGVRQPPGI